MDEDAWFERYGQAVNIELGQMVVRIRPDHLSRDRIRQMILLNPACDLWLVETDQMFIVGLGKLDLEVLDRDKVDTELAIEPILMAEYAYYKWLVERFHGQFVAVPPSGYELMHTVEFDAQERELVVRSTVVDLVYPWYQTTPAESRRLIQMSLALCRAVNLPPKVVYTVDSIDSS